MTSHNQKSNHCFGYTAHNWKVDLGHYFIRSAEKVFSCTIFTFKIIMNIVDQSLTESIMMIPFCVFLLNMFVIK